LKNHAVRKIRATVISVLGLAVFGSAEEPLVTDRPDFTESSSTVGSGLSWRLGG
jgi:hypothetical protein